MKKTTAILGTLAAAAMGLSHLALADGMKDPYKARELCEQRGKATSEKDLKACCSNMILVQSSKEQKKLEAQCVKGKGASAKK